MVRRTLILLALALALFSVSAMAQSSNSSSAGTGRSSDRAGQESPFSSPEDEMRARNEIKIAEKSFKENLERAREAAQLSEEIRDAFAASKTLDKTAQKKIERLEKLVRRIRSQAGGSDEEIPPEKLPKSLDSAVAQLVELSETVLKAMEKTSRHVVSATLIERANEMIAVIEFIRANAP